MTHSANPGSTESCRGIRKSGWQCCTRIDMRSYCRIANCIAPVNDSFLEGWIQFFQTRGYPRQDHRLRERTIHCGWQFVVEDVRSHSPIRTFAQAKLK